MRAATQHVAGKLERLPTSVTETVIEIAYQKRVLSTQHARLVRLERARLSGCKGDRWEACYRVVLRKLGVAREEVRVMRALRARLIRETSRAARKKVTALEDVLADTMDRDEAATVLALKKVPPKRHDWRRTGMYLAKATMKHLCSKLPWARIAFLEGSVPNNIPYVLGVEDRRTDRTVAAVTLRRGQQFDIVGRDLKIVGVVRNSLLAFDLTERRVISKPTAASRSTVAPVARRIAGREARLVHEREALDASVLKKMPLSSVAVEICIPVSEASTLRARLMGAIRGENVAESSSRLSSLEAARLAALLDRQRATDAARLDAMGTPVVALPEVRPLGKASEEDEWRRKMRRSLNPGLEEDLSGYIGPRARPVPQPRLKLKPLTSDEEKEDEELRLKKKESGKIERRFREPKEMAALALIESMEAQRKAQLARDEAHLGPPGARLPEVRAELPPRRNGRGR